MSIFSLLENKESMLLDIIKNVINLWNKLLDEFIDEHPVLLNNYFMDLEDDLEIKIKFVFELKIEIKFVFKLVFMFMDLIK